MGLSRFESPYITLIALGVVHGGTKPSYRLFDGIKATTNKLLYMATKEHMCKQTKKLSSLEGRQSSKKQKG